MKPVVSDIRSLAGVLPSDTLVLAKDTSPLPSKKPVKRTNRVTTSHLSMFEENIEYF